ncbi:MAG: zinc ribbon domain-containing protein [Planctomycetota bacterium]
MRRKWPLRITVSLSAGILLTLSSAWILPNLQSKFTQLQTPLLVVDIGHELDFVFAKTTKLASSFEFIMTIETHKSSNLAHHEFVAYDDPRLPNWYEHPTRLDQPWVHTIRVLKHGWPFKCLRAEFITNFHFDLSTSLGSTRRGLFGRRIERWSFPYLIEWIPFTANVLIYTLAAYLLAFGYKDARLFLRIRRGRCTSCGYDLSGTSNAPCPECGSECDKATPAAR